MEQREEIGKGNEPIPIKVKAISLAKERQRVAKAFCLSSWWAVTAQTWTRMVVDYASTLRLANAQTLQMVVSAQEVGTYAAGKIVMPRTLKKTTTAVRSDGETASATWSTPVRLCMIA